MVVKQWDPRVAVNCIQQPQLWNQWKFLVNKDSIKDLELLDHLSNCKHLK
jgi:hypothetical protein